MRKHLHPFGVGLNTQVQKLRQHGSSVIEMMGAVAIGTGVMVGVADQTNRYLDNTRAVRAAEYQAAFSKAALQYIKGRNGNSDRSSWPKPGEVEVVLLSNIQQLVPAANALSDQNPFQETTCLLIKTRSGANPKLEGLVVSSGNPSTGRAEVIQRRAIVTGMAGLATGTRQGGALAGPDWRSDTGVADWKLNIKSCTGGRVPEGGVVTNLQLLDLVDDMGGGGAATDLTGVLHRKFQSTRALNAMETTLTLSGSNSDIKMEGNDIRDANTLTLSGTLQEIRGLSSIATYNGGTQLVSFSNQVVKVNVGLEAGKYVKVVDVKTAGEPCLATEKDRYVRDSKPPYGLLHCDGTTWNVTHPGESLSARYVDSGDPEDKPGVDYAMVLCQKGEIAISGGGTVYGGARYQENITYDPRTNRITDCDFDAVGSACYGVRSGIDGGHPVWQNGLMGWAISGSLMGPGQARFDKGNKIRVYAICVKGTYQYAGGTLSTPTDPTSFMSPRP